MGEIKKETRNLARDKYLSWLVETQIDKMLWNYQKRQFGLGSFLFYFGASMLGACVAQVLSRCFS